MDITYRALCVGVSEYDDSSISKLTPCDKEALDVFKAFTNPNIRFCNHIESTILTSQELEDSKVSNRSNIISSLDRLCSLSTENEGIVLYFSGHGTEFGQENILFQGILQLD